MSDSKIKEALKIAAPDGKLSCKEAWALAEELGADKAEVGKAANELKIKIHSCQLGCF